MVCEHEEDGVDKGTEGDYAHQQEKGKAKRQQKGTKEAQPPKNAPQTLDFVFGDSGLHELRGI